MKRLLCLVFILQLCVLPLCSCSAPQVTAPAAAAAPAPADPAIEAPVPSEAPDEAVAPAYSYITAQELYSLLQQNASVSLVDIQPEEYYTKYGHIQGAVSTEAYPANDEKLLSTLDSTAVETANFELTVLIDMAGKAGVHNAYDYLVSAGADASKLRILKDGMMGWSYPEMVETEPEPYEYQFIKPRDVRHALRNEEKLILIDFRDNAAYELMHIKSSVNIPISGEDGSPAKALSLIAQESFSPVVIITADGGADAQGYYDYFARHSIGASRLFILENGIDAWPEDYKRYAVFAEEAQTETQDASSAASEAQPASLDAETPVEPAPEQEEIHYYG